MNDNRREYGKKVGTVIGWGIALTICSVALVAVVVLAIKIIQWLLGLL